MAHLSHGRVEGHDLETPIGHELWRRLHVQVVVDRPLLRRQPRLDAFRQGIHEDEPDHQSRTQAGIEAHDQAPERMTDRARPPACVLDWWSGSSSWMPWRKA